MKKVIVTGASGQIGSELTLALRAKVGNENVLATDIKEPGPKVAESGPFEKLDCTDFSRLREMVRSFECDTIYHLAALLSAVAEQRPQDAWEVNINGLYRILESAREFGCAVFTPSSIAAFGPSSPGHDPASQHDVWRHQSLGGITLRLLPQAIRCGYTGPAISGHHFA